VTYAREDLSALLVQGHHSSVLRELILMPWATSTKQIAKIVNPECFAKEEETALQQVRQVPEMGGVKKKKLTRSPLPDSETCLSINLYIRICSESKKIFKFKKNWN